MPIHKCIYRKTYTITVEVHAKVTRNEGETDGQLARKVPISLQNTDNVLQATVNGLNGVPRRTVKMVSSKAKMQLGWADLEKRDD